MGRRKRKLVFVEPVLRQPGLLGDAAPDVQGVLYGERRWAVTQGDGRRLLEALPDACLDAVITDPPYGREFLSLYAELAAELPRVLKWGGSFLAIVPHYSLPAVMAEVGRHLKYRWTLCMWQEPGDHARLSMGIEVVWKPIVWWVNGTWPQGRGFIKDGFVNAQPSKAHHKWEQSLTWAEYCMRFVPENGLVLDPLMGSGTVGVACQLAGARFLGSEQQAEHIITARWRLGQAAQHRHEYGPQLPSAFGYPSPLVVPEPVEHVTLPLPFQSYPGPPPPGGTLQALREALQMEGGEPE